MAVIETWLKQDLKHLVPIRTLNGGLFTQDGSGNLIGVEVYDGGEAYALTGSIQGYCVLADGSTVPVTGVRSGNRATITLPASAYSVPGPIQITIKNTVGSGTSAVITTLAACVGYVTTSRTGSTIDPGSVVTDWTNAITAQLQACQDAADNMGAIVAVPYDSITFPVDVGTYCTNNGNLYCCTTPIATRETFTSSHWRQTKVGTELGDLKSALSCELFDNNSLDSVAVSCSFKNGTSGTVTYSWNGNVCTVNGTASSTSYNIMYDSKEKLPFGMEAGKTYRVKVDTTSTSLFFDMYYYVGSTSTRIGSFTEDSTVTIPANATGLVIRARVTTNATVSNASGKIRILSELTNAELRLLAESIVSDYLPVKYARYSGITTTTDYNDIITPGVYQVASSSSAPDQAHHCPVQAAHILIVVQTYATDRHLQIVASTSGIFWRMHTNHWYDWERAATYDETEHLKDHVDVYDYSCDAKQDTQTSGDTTYTYLGDGKWSVVTGTSPNAYYNLFNESTFVNFHAGQKLFVYFKSDSGATFVQTFKYVDGQTPLVDSPANGWITIPSDATGYGIRLRTTGQMNGTVEFHLYKESAVLQMMTDMKESVDKCSVNILKSSSSVYNYLIRCEYDDENDIVYGIGIPSKKYNCVVSMDYMRLIAKDTPIENTESAYTGADAYKPLDDEIPAMRINDIFVGSNHGNPNYTRVNCQHSLTESDIGTIWMDAQANSYTLVNVFPGYLIFGTLDSNQQLTVRNPQTLTNGTTSTTLVVTSSEGYQLRRSAINKQYSIRNDCGVDVSNGGGGNNIIITEEYDINDQSAGLAYLQNHSGNCTNSSYYDDGQTTILCHIVNTFQFNRNGSMTCYQSLIAKKSIVNNKVYAAMSLDFGSHETGYTDYLYVPNSGNCKSIKSLIGLDGNVNITDDQSSPIMHHRYYQIAGNGSGNKNGLAHFLHLIDMGCYDESTRRNSLIVENPAWHSKTAEKFYTNITGETQMSNGDVLSWGCGRGPYKYTADQTVLCWFDYNQGYIVSMDWHSGHSGLVKLPYYMAGESVEILEKTDSVTVADTVVTNVGIQVSCSGYGYVVMYLH